jgi:CPA2 family monovalent cation:H+ antiporter-2
MTLVAHGEFSIIIAGLGGSVEPRLGPLAAAYVLLMAILGPITARLIPGQKNHSTQSPDIVH